MAPEDYAAQIKAGKDLVALDIRTPAEAQFFPVYAVLARDFDGDAKVDLLLGGNFHGVTPVYELTSAQEPLTVPGPSTTCGEPPEGQPAAARCATITARSRTARWTL